MIAVLSLLVVLVLSILVTRVATVALTLTGLSRQSARFQARSAFTGVGFTTSEAEGVVNHPVRRRILMLLMLLGNAGIVTVVSSLIITFVRTGGSDGDGWTHRIILLVGGLIVLMWLAQSSWLDRHLSRLIGRALQRWTDLDTRDYSSLLQLGGDYRIVELTIEPTDWMADRTLRELQLNQEGVLCSASRSRVESIEERPAAIRGSCPVRRSSCTAARNRSRTSTIGEAVPAGASPIAKPSPSSARSKRPRSGRRAESHRPAAAPPPNCSRAAERSPGAERSHEEKRK